MNDLSPESRAILSAGRHLDDPRPSDRARVRRALFTRVAAGGAAVLVSSSSAAAATVVKVVVATALVVGAGVGGTVWWRAQQAPAAKPEVQASSPRVAMLALPTEEVSPSVETPPATAPVAAAAPAVIAPRAAAVKSRAVATPSRNLSLETSLLAEANEALRDGDTRMGLRLLDEYDRRFPRGTLRQEMIATRIIARCQLIPSARNREAARLFLAEFPASPLAARVRSSCAGSAR